MAKSSRIRKDCIVSTTMSHNIRVLTDTLADARGMTRSEYIRFLVVKDAEIQAPRVVAAAAEELLDNHRGRPDDDESLTSSYIVDESKAEYGRLLREFGMFVGQHPVGNALFTPILGEPCIVWNETAYNYDDFVKLSKEDRTDILEARLQQIKDQEMAIADKELRDAELRR